MNIETRMSEILSRLQGVKKNGNGHLAVCPAHADSTPSLSVGEGRDGNVVLRCFAGCEAQSIMDAISLPMSYLFGDTQRQSEPAKVSISKILTPDDLRKIEDAKVIEKALRLYCQAVNIIGTPGGAYLESRGIPEALADNNRARYAPRFPVKIKDDPVKIVYVPAVVFPIHSPTTKEIVGLNARLITPLQDEVGNTIKGKSRGKLVLGVYVAPGANKLPEPIIVEAPIDALSLVAAGFPAFATCGASNLRYFPEIFAGKTVICGFDMDRDPNTLEGHRRNMRKFKADHGGRVVWVKPPGGELKDWNDMLRRYGAEGLASYMRRAGEKCVPPVLIASKLIQRTGSASNRLYACSVCRSEAWMFNTIGGGLYCGGCSPTPEEIGRTPDEVRPATIEEIKEEFKLWFQA